MFVMIRFSLANLVAIVSVFSAILHIIQDWEDVGERLLKATALPLRGLNINLHGGIWKLEQ